MIDISSNIAVIRETSSGSELRTNIASGMETLAGKAASSDDVTAANESVAAMETKITSSKSIHTKYGKYIAIQKRPTRQNQSQIGTGFRQNHFAVWKMRQRCVLYNLR